MIPSLRLLAGATFAAAGVLAFVPAPTTSFLSASVVATEFGHYLVAAAILVVFMPGQSRTVAGRLGALFGLAAVALLLKPVVQATEMSRTLPDLVAARLGTAERPPAEFADSRRPAPFALLELIRPVRSTPVRYEARTFKGAEGDQVAIHIYRPAYPHGPIPGVIVVHGESWESVGGSERVALNGYLAARDLVVVSISDRLDPRRPFPGARNDVVSTIAYLKAHASELGLDPTRLALLGRSLAGHLALLAAYTANDPAIRGAISLYAPSDFERWYTTAAERGALDTRGILRGYLGGPPDGSRKVYDAASPITFVRRETPATLLVHGMHDQVVPPEQSERLDARLEEAGVRHLLVRLPWATHGCDKNFAGPCGQITTYLIERFLNVVMKDSVSVSRRRS